MTPAKAVAACNRVIRLVTAIRNDMKALAVHGVKKHARKLPQKRRATVRIGMRFRASNGYLYTVIASEPKKPDMWKCVPVKVEDAPNLYAASKVIIAKQTQFQPRKAW